MDENGVEVRKHVEKGRGQYAKKLTHKMIYYKDFLLVGHNPESWAV